MELAKNHVKSLGLLDHPGERLARSLELLTKKDCKDTEMGLSASFKCTLARQEALRVTLDLLEVALEALKKYVSTPEAAIVLREKLRPVVAKLQEQTVCEIFAARLESKQPAVALIVPALFAEHVLEEKKRVLRAMTKVSLLEVTSLDVPLGLGELRLGLATLCKRAITSC